MLRTFFLHLGEPSSIHARDTKFWGPTDCTVGRDTLQATEYTECWPCPRLHILINKYFPAIQPSDKWETLVYCWCRLTGNVLHHTYPLEYKIFSSQPRQKSCWASSLRILPLGCKQLHPAWGGYFRGTKGFWRSAPSGQLSTFCGNPAWLYHKGPFRGTSFQLLIFLSREKSLCSQFWYHLALTSSLYFRANFCPKSQQVSLHN